MSLNWFEFFSNALVFENQTARCNGNTTGDIIVFQDRYLRVSQLFK